MRNYRYSLHAVIAVAAVTAAAMLVSATPALGAAEIYWGNVAGPNPISFANLDGLGGGNLITTGATPEAPWGVTIDSAAGKIYWVNNDNNTGQTDGVSFANLGGSGGGTLNTPGLTAANPEGVAVDPAAGTIYWANPTTETIAFANLDGSGGGTLNTLGATVATPDGVAIDPAAGKIYWANSQSATTPISFANLNGSGGGNLTTTGATPNGAEGVAIDTAAGKIYWANNNSNTKPISFATLNGSGGGNLTVTGAMPDGAFGVAIDPAAGRIYWVNEDSSTVPISFANLAGSGGGNLTTTGATPDIPGWPSLLEPPSGSGAPVISGGSKPTSTLACTQGSWAPDLLESFLYRAPQSLAFSWTRNGAPIAGAAASMLKANSPGAYACRVTAENHAGSASQVSAAHTIFGPPSCSLRAPARARKGALRLTARCNQAASLTLSGKITVVPKSHAGSRRHGRKPKTFRIATVRASVVAGKSRALTVKLPKAARTALNHGARESALLTLTARNVNGSSKTTAKIKRV